MTEELKHDKWKGTTYGNGWMHKWLIRMLRAINVRVLYAFTFLFIIPPTLIINRKATKSTYHFYKTAFRLRWLKACWMTFKNHCAFSQVVIDKFAMYAGKKFRITTSGYEEYLKLDEETKGFIQLSAHIGNYELAGYSLVSKTKRFNALVFGGEKESVMHNRNKLFEANNIRMIPMQEDMQHLFTIDKALEDGEILSMPADRVFGSQKAFIIDFFGYPAKFPQGPFILASMKEVPTLFVAVMKTGVTKYHIYIEKLVSQSGGNLRENAKILAENYVRSLESMVRSYPAQWYNYFNIWTN